MSAGTETFAEAIRGHTSRQTLRARNVVRGTVVKRKPFKVRLHETPIVLDDGDIEFCGWMATYHAEWGIEVGDEVVLMRESGDWVLLDLVTEEKNLFTEAKSIRAVKARIARLEARAADATGFPGEVARSDVRQDNEERR